MEGAQNAIKIIPGLRTLELERSHLNGVQSVIAYESELNAICITGSCSPPPTLDKCLQHRLRRYKKTLRRGDRETSKFITMHGYYFVLLDLEVLESKTCAEHPLELGNL